MIAARCPCPRGTGKSLQSPVSLPPGRPTAHCAQVEKHVPCCIGRRLDSWAVGRAARSPCRPAYPDPRLTLAVVIGDQAPPMRTVFASFFVCLFCSCVSVEKWPLDFATPPFSLTVTYKGFYGLFEYDIFVTQISLTSRNP